MLGHKVVVLATHLAGSGVRAPDGPVLRGFCVNSVMLVGGFMEEKVLDCRNLQCPQPVIQLKRLLDAASPAHIEVLVDNEPALENVSRFLSSRGYSCSLVREGELWRITAQHGLEGHGSADATSGATALEKVQPLRREAAAEEQGGAMPEKILVLLISPVFGSGDDGLGARLMKTFLATLPEMGESLWRVVMLNGGVTLAAEESPVLEELRALEERGVGILVCGTCLEHFGLLAKKAVGQTTNMLDVVTSMQLADKTLRV